MTHDPKLVEAVARRLCVVRGIDPDRPVLIDGHIRTLAWEFQEDATAALDAIEAQGWVVVPREALEQAMRGFEMVQPTLERLVSGELIAVPASHPSMPIRNDNPTASQNVSTPSNTSTSIASPDVG